MTRYIISAILIAAAAGIFMFYTQPAYDSVQAANGQIAQYNSALDKAAQLQALKQGLLNKYNAFSPNDLARLQKLLPDHVDNVALILDLDNLAQQYGLALANVDVSQPASAATSKTAVGVAGAAGQKYDSLTIKFTTHGTYRQFTQFMTELESSLRIVDLVSLSITGDGSPAQGGSTDPVYTFSINLRTYWLK